MINRRGPWRHLEAAEFATLDWVDWFNTCRLLEPIGHVPPAEYEQAYYRAHETPAMGAKVSGEPGAVQATTFRGDARVRDDEADARVQLAGVPLDIPVLQITPSRLRRARSVPSSPRISP